MGLARDWLWGVWQRQQPERGWRRKTTSDGKNTNIPRRHTQPERCRKKKEKKKTKMILKKTRQWRMKNDDQSVNKAWRKEGIPV